MIGQEDEVDELDDDDEDYGFDGPSTVRSVFATGQLLSICNSTGFCHTDGP